MQFLNYAADYRSDTEKHANDLKKAKSPE